jgi:hypothetical protein
MFRKTMSRKKTTLYLVMFSLAATWAVEARSGVTISDRRYWPSEARGSPAPAIEIYPPANAFAGPLFPSGVAVVPRVTSRGKARRPH